jgi:3-oxoacyl-[acyl-carrier protein] reductase
VSQPDRADETVKAAHALGVKALAIKADSADAKAVFAAVERTAAELGGIDILVNNAGIAAMAPIDDSRLDEFDRTVAVNLRAVFSDLAGMLRKLMALPRYGTADEIAAMVAFLAGPEAGFVTGASLRIDGGFTA